MRDLRITAAVEFYGRETLPVLNTESSPSTLSSRFGDYCLAHGAEEVYRGGTITLPCPALQSEIPSPVPTPYTLQAEYPIKGQLYSGPFVVAEGQRIDVIIGLDILATIGFRLFLSIDTLRLRAQPRECRRRNRRERRRLLRRGNDEGLGSSNTDDTE